MIRRDSSLIAFSRRVIWPMAALLLFLTLLRISPLPWKHVFTVLFTAVLLAAAVAPAARFMTRYRIPRGVTILLIYLVVVLVLVGVVALVVPLVVDEIDQLRGSLPGYADDLRSLVRRVAPDQAQKFSSGQLFGQLSGDLGSVASQLSGVIFTTISTGVSVILILVIAYFLAAEESLASLTVSRFVPPAHRQTVTRILGKMGTRLGQWARAQLLLALFFGAAFALGLSIIGVNYAVTLGVVGGVLEIIPYVGGFITLALAVLVALTQDPIKVVFVIIWYTVVVELEGHVIAPKLMDRVLGIHPLVVVVALFLGAEALGILGALLAVPIAIVFQVLLDEFYRFDEIVSEAAAEEAAALQPPQSDGASAATAPPVSTPGDHRRTNT